MCAPMKSELLPIRVVKQGVGFGPAPDRHHEGVGGRLALEPWSVKPGLLRLASGENLTLGAHGTGSGLQGILQKPNTSN